MKALILAAGMGSRLKPLTNTLPKALVLVQGKPLLYYAIEKLAAVGVTEIIINVHHLADQIIEYIENAHFPGIQLSISDERETLLDTGGGLQKTAPFFDDGQPFFVYNVDIFTAINLTEMLQFHLKNQALATMAVADRITSRYLLFDNFMWLHGWGDIQKNITIPENIQINNFKKKAFSGIHIVNPILFHLLDKTGNFPIIPEYVRLCNQYPILGYDHTGVFWLDVGKPEYLSLANSPSLASPFQFAKE